MRIISTCRGHCIKVGVNGGAILGHGSGVVVVSRAA
jgi:hypothetical protein